MATSGDTVGLHISGDGTTGTQWVETRNAQGSPTSQHYLAPSVHSAEARASSLGRYVLDVKSETVVSIDNIIGCFLKLYKAPASVPQCPRCSAWGMKAMLPLTRWASMSCGP